MKEKQQILHTTISNQIFYFIYLQYKNSKKIERIFTYNTQLDSQN